MLYQSWLKSFFYSSYPKLYEIVSDRSASNGNCTGILNDAMLVLLQSMEHEHQSNSLLLRIFILCVWDAINYKSSHGIHEASQWGNFTGISGGLYKYKAMNTGKADLFMQLYTCIYPRLLRVFHFGRMCQYMYISVCVYMYTAIRAYIAVATYPLNCSFRMSLAALGVTHNISQLRPGCYGNLCKCSS